MTSHRRTSQGRNKPRTPKFRVGQVVKHRIAGGFYMRVLACPHVGEEPQIWTVAEQGKIKFYRDEQLRPLTRRERGPAREG